MRRRGWICIVLSVAMIPLFGCKKPEPSNEAREKTHIELEIVERSDQFCYAVANEDDDSPVYAFVAAGQPIFDEEGQSVTGTALEPGILVRLEYDGYILDSTPCLFSNVSEVRIIGRKT